MNIMELLAERQRQRTQQGRAQQGMVTAIVVRRDGPRYIVNDGISSVPCETMLSENLSPGDHVLLARGRAVNVIMGRIGKDLEFA